jgi:hypothetical protein
MAGGLIWLQVVQYWRLTLVMIGSQRNTVHGWRVWSKWCKIFSEISIFSSGEIQLNLILCTKTPPSAVAKDSTETYKSFSMIHGDQDIRVIQVFLGERKEATVLMSSGLVTCHIVISPALLPTAKRDPILWINSLGDHAIETDSTLSAVSRSTTFPAFQYNAIWLSRVIYYISLIDRYVSFTKL